MVVTAYYDNNTNEIISDYTIDIDRALTKDDTKFTISYTYKNITKTIDQNISVNQYTTLYTSKNVGDIITIPHSAFGNIDFLVIGKDQDGEGKLTLLSKNIIKLMTFDAAEPGNTIGDGLRARHGNNRYLYSNILQWMNSEASSDWFTKQHSYDTPPNSSNVWTGCNPYDTISGFLYGFSDEFKEVLTTVSKKTVVPSCDGGNYEYVNSKMFLLSKTEIGLDNENNIEEGSIYTYFSNNNTSDNRIAKWSSYAQSSSNYPNHPTAGNNGYYWLRTPNSGYSYSVCRVNTNGSLGNYSAFYGNFGLRVACVI